MNLHELLRMGPLGLPAECTSSFGQLVRGMHDAGFFAHDLHMRNVLVGDRDAAKPRFVLLDFPNGRVLARDDPRRQAAMIYDLASLDLDACRYLSRPARLRFLKAYTGDRHADRSLVRAIDQRRRRQISKSRLRSAGVPDRAQRG